MLGTRRESLRGYRSCRRRHVGRPCSAWIPFPRACRRCGGGCLVIRGRPSGWAVANRQEAVANREAGGYSNALRTSMCDRQVFRRPTAVSWSAFDGNREPRPTNRCLPIITGGGDKEERR